LRALESAEGIFFLVAHAEGCHFSIPGGTGAISITPADIAQLHLAKSPIVILRICDGIDNGYASAFIKAGARSVWANKGVISAKAANEQIELFMKFSSEGDSVQEAIRRVEELIPTANNAAGLITQLFDRGFKRFEEY
jgi:hypothetical protein